MFPRKRLVLNLGAALLLVVLLEVNVASAHPEEFEERVSGAELARREHLAQKRHLAARSCASSINAFHASRRRAKRDLYEQVPLTPLDGEMYDAASDEANWDNDELKESTCVTTPELEEGPYYVNNELVRTDLVEDQEGIVITLDIGVIDTATCEPVPNAFVEIWSANATGVYGSFESKVNGGPPPGRGGRPDHGPDTPPRDRRPPPPDRRPPGRPGGPGRGPPGGSRGGPSMSSNHTWLRGGHPTDTSGTISLTTLYPGFYPGRTIHIHTMIHTDWEQFDNGTLISHSGKVRHIGQMFFDEIWNDKVLEREPYTFNTARRTRNDEDHDFRRALIDRSSAIIEVEMLGESLDDGLLGFITIGVDMSADYSIHSKNYYNSSADPDIPSYVADINM